MRNKNLEIFAWPVSIFAACALVRAQEPQPSAAIGETPAIQAHLDHDDIVARRYSFGRLFRLGQNLFKAKFNTLDGQGRPAATGNGAPTPRDSANDPGFLRTSGTDANSCAGCHNEPRSGGAGDFVVNVFVLAQVRDPVTFDVRESDERNTLGMFGAGAIELLGREMTDDLVAIRQAAIDAAADSGQDVTRDLFTKGVFFGRITAHPAGSVDTSQVQGVDADLILRPFHQKGAVRSIREFTVNAMNHHHGMQPVERFGIEQTGTRDFDQDGVEDELTIGDITAATLYQAALAVPAQVLPADPARRAAVRAGRRLFRNAGCASCHKMSLVLNSPMFCEPYGRNPPGTFNDTSRAYCFDLTKAGETPLLRRSRDRKIRVRAFTDLKRHVICDDARPIYCNETLVQAGIPTNQFITRKLWDVGSSAPYGHRGDLTTITEAILAHGGEANASRQSFEALGAQDQARIVEFLKSLQVLEDTRIVGR
jgi:cytochrome c553